MLTLDLRGCTLGAKYSGDRKERDNGDVRTLTFELEDLMLDRREFNALLGEPYAWEALFNTGANPPEPLLQTIKALELENAVEGAFVRVVYGLNAHSRAFTGCKLTKIKLALQKGGQVAMSCKVTCEPDIDEELADFIAQMGNTAECEIRAELPSEQQDLPLSTIGDNEQAEAQ